MYHLPPLRLANRDPCTYAMPNCEMTHSHHWLSHSYNEFGWRVWYAIRLSLYVYLEFQFMMYGGTFNFITIWFTVWSLTKEKVIFAATRSIVVCVISVSRVVTSLSCRASLSDHSLPCFKVLLGLLETLFTFSSTIAWNCSLFKNRETVMMMMPLEKKRRGEEFSRRREIHENCNSSPHK